MTASADIPSWLKAFDVARDAPVSRDPLSYPGYAEQLQEASVRTGLDESVVWGTARVAGHECVAVTFSFAFMGGSLGEATGRRVVDAIDYATSLGMPLITYIRSGGARIQEGLRSLSQMQAIAAALERLRCVGQPHIAVVLDPTTGGVWASLAAGADVIIAAEHARVAFAGARVRTVRKSEVDESVFTAAGKYGGGFVDQVVAVDDLDATVCRYANVLFAPARQPMRPCPLPRAIGVGAASGGWASVLGARSSDRPRADAYLADYFDEFVTISGDRVSGRDPGMLCGFGLKDGAPAAFVAQTGSENTPAGFRTATRLLETADSLRLPVLTLVDTPGAANDAHAEASGVGSAIAQVLARMARMRTPVTSLVIGEGGSGGALALCSPGNTWITPDAYFAVIAPESAAAILYRDAGLAPAVAASLRLGPHDVVELGVAAGVLIVAA